MQPLMPEFFMLIAIDFFLATSVVTCFFEKHLPNKLSYLYQLAALVGFGQLLVTRSFVNSFADYMRFWYSLIFLCVAVANIAGLNAYLFFYKKKKTIAKLFSVIITVPATIISIMFVYNYATSVSYPIILLPQLPLSIIFAVVFVFDVLLVSTGIYVLIKPEWWKVTIATATILAAGNVFIYLRGAFGEVAFAAGMLYTYVVLEIACIGILGAGLFIFLRYWWENYRR